MRILLSMFLCAVCAFSGEILVSKSFTIIDKIKPQFFFANIHIQSSEKLRNIGELSTKNRGNITKTLNGIIAEAKKTEICKGGSYEISPIISYKDEKRTTIGQSVEFALECKFRSEDLGAYNALLATIDNMVNKNALLVLPQPRIDSRITQEEINDKKEAMFAEFLAQSGQIAKNYAANLGKTCAIKKITTSDSYAPVPLPRLKMANAVALAESADSATNTSAPIENEREVEITIAMELGCE